MRFIYRLCIIALPVMAIVMARAADLPAKDFFAAERLHQIEVQLTAENWDKMQPPGGMAGPGGPPPQDKDRDRERDKDKDKERDKDRDGPPRPPGGGGPGNFGFDFTYVPGTVVIDGETVANIAVRFKGNSSYMVSARGIKHPFRFDFNRFESGKTFHDLKALSLANNAMDESQLRETLAYECFHEAGVPYSRSALAVVSLDVPEKYEHKFLGVYTVVEPVDKTFLNHRFGSHDGLLLKPERLPDLDDFGENWAKYQARYFPKGNASKQQKARLYELAHLVHKANEAEFAERIGTLLDVDEFLRFIACETLLANLDSFLTVGHNFYLYLDSKTDRFVFIPWDHNHAFGTFPMTGKPSQQADLSILHPYSGPNTLIERVLAIPANKAAYLKKIKTLAATAFAPETLHKKIDHYEAMIAEAKARERKAGNSVARPPRMPGGFGGEMPLKEFITERAKSVQAQLAEEKKGYVPERVGPPGRPKEKDKSKERD
ncbi:MAG: CotH kinase family protein [Gemmataceae bacterium]